MGHGYFDTNSYEAQATFRKAKGVKDFAYSAATRATARAAWKAHPTLDPKGVAFRECRDSADHPRTTPVAVLFDVTGSMHQVPQVFQRKLGKLNGLLRRSGVRDPQLMVGAIGDAESDQVPFQIGQFESDNAMDEQLRNIFLEGNGGGQMSESYELGAYFMLRHVQADAISKRGAKGYLFILGDEFNKSTLNRKHVKKVFGESLDEEMSIAELYRQLQRDWNVFFVLPNQTSHFNDPRVHAHWAELLSDNVLRLEDPEAVCELIAATVGIFDGGMNLDQAVAELTHSGSAREAAAVGKALAVVGVRGGGRAAIAAAPQGLDGDDDDEDVRFV